MTWLLDWIPGWVWLVVAIVVLLAAWRLLGLRGLLATGAGVAGLWTYRAGRKAGGADALRKQEQANDKAVKDHEDIARETGGMSDAELDEHNTPGVRKRR